MDGSSSASFRILADSGSASDAIIAVAATSFALIGVALTATWLAGWYDERVRRSRGAMKRGAKLRAGRVAIQGTLRPVDGRVGGRMMTTTRTQVIGRSGAWRDVSRSSSGSPFAIALANGDELLVDPTHVDLSGFPETAGSRYLKDSDPVRVFRDVDAHVSAGDEVWASGVLARTEAQGAGAYRSTASHRKLVPPRRGVIALTRESPVPRWQALAAAHNRGSVLAAGALVALHALPYRRLDTALFLWWTQSEALYGLRHEGVRFAAYGVLVVVAVLAFWRRRVQRARGARP